MQGLLAGVLAAKGETEEADSLYRVSIPRLDPGRPHMIAYACKSHANLYRDQRRWGEAESLYVRAEALYDTTSAAQRPFFGECLGEHAYMRALQGRHDEAEGMMQKAIAIQLEEDSPESPEMLSSYLRWAAARARAGNDDGAIEALRKAVSCGLTAQQASEYPELAGLRSRSDYPLGRSQ
jgi:tetratricopeptide (TPR) repeat protein